VSNKIQEREKQADPFSPSFS